MRDESRGRSYPLLKVVEPHNDEFSISIEVESSESTESSDEEVRPLDVSERMIN